MPKTTARSTAKQKRAPRAKAKNTRPETLAISVAPQPHSPDQPIKRKRGRPRKVRPEEANDQVQVVESSLVSVSSSVVADEPPKPIVRGRPKKEKANPPVAVIAEPAQPQTDTKVSVDWQHNVPGPTPPEAKPAEGAPVSQSVNALVDHVSGDLFAENPLLEQLLAQIDGVQVRRSAEIRAAQGAPVVKPDPVEDEAALTAYSNVRNEYVSNEPVALPSTGLALSEQESGLLRGLVNKVDALIVNAIRNNDARRRIALLQSSSAESKRRIEELLHRQTELVQALVARQMQLAEEAREREWRQAQEQLAYEREQSAARLERERQEAAERLERERKQAEAQIAYERQQAEQLRAQEAHRARMEQERERERAAAQLSQQRAENARLHAEAELYKNYAASDKHFLTAPFMDAQERIREQPRRAGRPRRPDRSAGEGFARPSIVSDAPEPEPLDPSPEPAIQALQEDYAPKRRGRKRKAQSTGLELKDEVIKTLGSGALKRKRGRPTGKAALAKKKPSDQEFFAKPRSKKK